MENTQSYVFGGPSRPWSDELSMNRLTNRELRTALDVLHAIRETSTGSADFGRRGVEWLPRLVPGELMTLVVCDLAAGHRSVVPRGTIAPRHIEVFDHYFYAHPLVREHGRNPRAVTKRISDLAATSAFRRTPLYNEYYRAIGRADSRGSAVSRELRAQPQQARLRRPGP